MKYVLAIDQGTTGTRAMIFDYKGQEVSKAYLTHRQIYPHAGWVEHNPLEIWDNTQYVVREAVKRANIEASEIVSIGITNQRETVVAWDSNTGQPLYNALVWQCRRTADICDQLKKEGYEETFKEKTGLVLDPYFSGTKIKWLIDNVPKIKEALQHNTLKVGTIDSWIIWKLTGNHVTDLSNASRTLLLNIHKAKWDDELLDILSIPESVLPELRPSSDKETYGTTSPELLGTEIPVTGDAGDQQAALFGQNCFEPGEVKNTYGTGNFMLMNTGTKAIRSDTGLLTTIAWKIENEITYALEGSVFITGAVIQWLENGLQILESKDKLTDIMLNLDSTDDVYFVPAFTGLGAPYWDPYARGLIVGITRGTTKDHIIRAALESICYQSEEVFQAMKHDSNRDITILRVDGGVTACDPLLQFQADISSVKVQRPEVSETTALGAAYLSGLAVGFWDSLKDIKSNFQINAEFVPRMPSDKKAKLLKKWREAVKRSKRWAIQQ